MMSYQQVSESLKKKGFHVKDKWLKSCMKHLDSIDIDLILEQLLCTDICQWNNLSVIPNDINALHKTTWKGVYVLQIEDVVNLCAAKFEKKCYNSHLKPQLLRVKLTDGYFVVYGLIHESVVDLNVDIVHGAKVLIKDAYIRRGYLMISNNELIFLYGGNGGNVILGESKEDNI